MASKKKQKVKVVKKEWYEVHAPKQFGKVLIGEVTSSDPKKLIGRTIKIPLSELTRNIRLQGIHIKLRIHDVSTKNAITIVEGYEILPAMLKRYVRRRRTRVDDSFVVETKDNVRVRVKPIIITAFKTKGEVVKNLRATMRKLLSDIIKNSSYDDFVSGVVNHKLQGELMAKLNKLYPIKYCEIRKFEITKAKPTKIEYKEKVLVKKTRTKTGTEEEAKEKVEGEVEEKVSGGKVDEKVVDEKTTLQSTA